MPGHVVRYAGVQVGTVKEVNVNGDSVDVVADINKVQGFLRERFFLWGLMVF